MTPDEFNRRMLRICKIGDTREVMREAVNLIRVELGEGMPAYLSALYRLFDRLKPESVEKLSEVPFQPSKRTAKAKKK